MEMLTPPETLERLDALQKNINDVLVNTGKVFKRAKINQVSPEQANLIVRKSVNESYNSFNYALDDLENEINRAKAVLLRDLGELRAKRMPPLTPPPEPKPVAPPAPMEFHMDPPSFDPTSAPGPPPAQSQSFQTAFQFPGTGPPMAAKQESKPVAPVPNMGGFEFSVSPEMAKAPSPALSQAKAKSMRASPKVSPKLKGAQTARPSSAPPKKEPRMTVSPQLSRTAAPTPQPAPATTPVAPPAPMNVAPLNIQPSAPSNPAPTPAPAPAPIAQPEMVFTDMAFSVDDSQQTHQQQQEQELDNMIDLTQFTDFGAEDSNLMNLAGTGGPLGGIDNSGNGVDGNSNSLAINNDSVSMSHVDVDMNNVDAEIDNILNSTGPGSAEKMDMDYELGGIGLDNNSFDDMFFDNVSGGEAEFGGDSYYGV